MPTLPDPQLVARLRAAGSVFAEDEAVLLTEASQTQADAAGPIELARFRKRNILQRTLGHSAIRLHCIATNVGSKDYVGE